ncbi:MAG: hypothetical protein ACHQC8_03295 [Solirubrobacterales bacterium]
MDEPGDPIEVKPAPLSLAEAKSIIARIEQVVEDQHVVLIGGQAVAMWIGQLQGRLQGLLTPEQAVSRDIDFMGNAADVQRAANLLGGPWGASYNRRVRRRSLTKPGAATALPALIALEVGLRHERRRLLDFQTCLPSPMRWRSGAI